MDTAYILDSALQQLVAAKRDCDSTGTPVILAKLSLLWNGCSVLTRMTPLDPANADVPMQLIEGGSSNECHCVVAYRRCVDIFEASVAQNRVIANTGRSISRMCLPEDEEENILDNHVAFRSMIGEMQNIRAYKDFEKVQRITRQNLAPKDLAQPITVKTSNTLTNTFAKTAIECPVNTILWEFNTSLKVKRYLCVCMCMRSVIFFSQFII
jgi:hypothetical protein